MRPPLLLLAGVALSVFAPAAHAQLAASPALTPERQREILHAALAAYDGAVAQGRDDPAKAAELYRQAGAGFTALLESGLRNAGLEYNLGNVYFRLGDLGQSILHYRRAHRLAPADPRVDANLRYARDRVTPVITASGEARLARQLLFWHYGTTATQRFWWLVALSLVGYGLLGAWLRWRRRGLLLSGIACVALGLAAGMSVRWELHDRAENPPAVVIAGNPYLRYDRDESSTENRVLKQPLGPGVEVRILQQRGDWVEVRLVNGQSGWLPAATVERI